MASPAAAPLSRRQIEDKIVARAWKDDAFRKRFLADPKGQFETELGTTLPAGLKMTAHAEDENHLHFVIPARPGNARELSDDELERVAGGATPVISIAVIAGAVTVGLTTAAASNAAAGAWDKK